MQLLSAFADNFNGTVIVTVITMRMMQVAIDEIIGVITMGYCLVSTARVVLMPRFVACATMIGCASVRVMRVDFYNVLLNERWVDLPHRVVKMSVVNVIDMAFVFDRDVAAVWGVPVTAVGMALEMAHKFGLVDRSLLDPGQKRNIIGSHALHKFAAHRQLGDRRDRQG